MTLMRKVEMMKWKAALAGLCFATIGSASAQELRVIVPFAPGGADVMIRAIMAETKLNQTIVVEPKGGAGGQIGTSLAAAAKPDGNTIVMATLGSLVIAPTINGKASYDALKSFEPLALVGKTQIIIVAKPSLPVTNLKELVALVKGGAKLSFASAGTGTTTQIAMELFKIEAGIDITHIPYRGGIPAIADVAAGHVDVYSGDIYPLMGHLQGKTLRPLGVFDPVRAVQIPDVPTSIEQGFPGALMHNWTGLLAPAGIPREAKERLEKAILMALHTPVIAERLNSTGMTNPLNSADFRKMLEEDYARWTVVIPKMGLKEE